jgi:hypothetical protein
VKSFFSRAALAEVVMVGDKARLVRRKFAAALSFYGFEPAHHRLESIHEIKHENLQAEHTTCDCFSLGQTCGRVVVLLFAAAELRVRAAL